MKIKSYKQGSGKEKTKSKLELEEEQKNRENAGIITTTIFPSTEIHPDFFRLVKQAMLTNCIVRVKCHKETWKRLAGLTERDMFMPEVYLGLEILRHATPQEMNQTLKENVDMIENVCEPMYASYAKLYESVRVQ